MKLKRATYRHVEAEIYDYYKTLQAMDEFRLDIILGLKKMITKLWK